MNNYIYIYITLVYAPVGFLLRLLNFKYGIMDNRDYKAMNNEPMAYDTLLECVIYRIDGNRCFSAPNKGMMGYYKTREGAEKYLQERGFYIETRKWQHIGGHEEGTNDNKWYNKKLSDDGYSYDNTSYAFITEVKLRD